MPVNIGLNLDDRPLLKENNSWLDAKNIVLAKGFKCAKNEDGFSNVIPSSQLDLTIIGSIPFPTGIVYFSTNNTLSEIGIYENNVYTKILRSLYLGFNLNNPIEGAYQYNYKGDLVVAWWGLNVVSGLLNLTNLPFAVTIAKEIAATSYATASELSELSKLNPNVSSPILTTNVIDGGGIESGIHYFALSYIYINGDETNYILLPSPTSVFLKETLFVNDGINHTTQQGKLNRSIDLSFSSLDNKFDSFRLVDILKQNGIVTAYDIGIYSLTTSERTTKTKSLNFSGDTKSSIAIDDVILPTENFDYIKTGTVLDNELIIGNVKQSAFRDSNGNSYQVYANLIQVTWESVALGGTNPQVYPNPMGYKCMMPDEVYALYIHWILKDGTITEGYHIPGRLPRDYVEETGHAISETKNMRFYNTPVVPPYTYPPLVSGEELAIDSGNATIFQLRDTATYSDKKMGYWQNQDEYYPTDDDLVSRYGSTAYLYGDFACYDVVAGSPSFVATDFGAGANMGFKGMNVRHHKMPSIKIVNNGVGGGSMGANFRLEPKFANIKIPNELLSKVQGYFFSYAKRDIDNSTILGSSVLVSSDIDNPGVNNNLRFYDYPLLNKKPNISPNYVKSSFRSELNETHVPLSTLDIVDAYTVTDFLAPNAALDVTLSNGYFPMDNSATIPDNTDREETLHINTRGHRLTNENAPDPTGIHVPPSYLHVGNLYSHRYNVFINFYNQLLSRFSNIYRTTTSNVYTASSLIGGDVITNDLRFYYNVYSGGGLVMQYYIKTWIHSPYMVYFSDGKISYTPPSIPTFDELTYDDTLSSIYDIGVPSPHNPIAEYIEELKFRIFKSNPQQNETLKVAWRKFLTNNYFDLKQNKGEIWKLSTLDKLLCINQKYSLFVGDIKSITSDRGIAEVLSEVVQGYTNVEARLGAEDILNREPREVIWTDIGYCGNKSQYCVFTTTFGLVFVDEEQGKIFLFTGKEIKEISDSNTKEFFRKNIPISTDDDIDNPFTLFGYTGSYDQENERLIITKKDYYFTDPLHPYKGRIENVAIPQLGAIYVVNGSLVRCTQVSPFTHTPLTTAYYTESGFSISYNFITGKWICKHDYLPSTICYNRKGLYSANNNLYGSPLIKGVYKHNDNTKKGIYYKATPYESYIDIIFNNFNGQTVCLESIHWKADFIDYLNTHLYNKTITGIMVYNESQCSDIIPVNDNNVWFSKDSGSTVYDSWFFNEFKDVVLNNLKPFLDSNNQPYNATNPAVLSNPTLLNVSKNSKNWFDLSIFISKFVVIRLIYDNRIESGKQADLYLLDVDIEGQTSNIN